MIDHRLVERVNKAHAELRDVEKIVAQECPSQREQHGVVAFCWGTNLPMPADRFLGGPYYLLVVGRSNLETDISAFTAEDIARFGEIRRELRAWTSNEGPWPLAQKAW